MQITKIIIIALCIILAGVAICYYLKLRRLLGNNSNDELDNIAQKIQSLTNKLAVIMYVLVAVFAIYIIVLILEFVLKIL